MPEAPPLSEDGYVEFYEIDEPVIQFAEGANEIQHVQGSMIEVAEEQAKEKVWREVVSWVEQGRIPEKKETRGKTREVLVAPSMFDPEVFKMKDGVLMFTKAANRNRIGEVWRICFPESMVTEIWSLLKQSNLEGHRGLEGTINKILKGSFLLSARQKIHFLKGRCDTCLTKEWRMPAKTGVQVPFLAGFVGEKLYMDLVSMLETIRRNQYMLTATDSFSRYCQAYPIPNKEANTMAKVLWITTSMYTDYRTSCIQIMEENCEQFAERVVF